MLESSGILIIQNVTFLSVTNSFSASTCQLRRGAHIVFVNFRCVRPLRATSAPGRLSGLLGARGPPEPRRVCVRHAVSRGWVQWLPKGDAFVCATQRPSAGEPSSLARCYGLWTLSSVQGGILHGIPWTTGNSYRNGDRACFDHNS